MYSRTAKDRHLIRVRDDVKLKKAFRHRKILSESNERYVW